MKNRLTEKIAEAERACASKEELFELIGEGRSRMASVDGDVQEGTVYCGQIGGLITGLMHAGDVVRETITGGEGGGRNWKRRPGDKGTSLTSNSPAVNKVGAFSWQWKERPMDALEAILTRRSIRKYKNDPVDEKTIRTLLTAAMRTVRPNQQCWRLVVVNRPADAGGCG